MSFETLNLLKTVKNKYEAGEITLTAEDKNRIESETKDLIEKALRNKEAMPTPEGFDQLLMELQSSSPEESFLKVLTFMKDKGMIKGEPGGGGECPKEEMGGLGGKEPGLGLGEKSPELGLGDKEPGLGLGDKEPGLGLGGKEPGLPEKPVELEVEKKPMLDVGKDLEDKKPGMGGPEMGMDKDKSDLGDKKVNLPLSDSSGMPIKEEPSSGKPKEKSPEKGKDTEKEKKPVDLRSAKKQVLAEAKLLKEEEEDEEENDKISEDEMGVVKESSIKVKISSAGNITVVHKDHGPLFHSVPNDSVKSDKVALRRAANKVAGWVKYEGVKAACAKSNGRWVAAGVDDNINFGGVDLPKATKGVDEGGCDVMDEALPKPKDTVLKEYEDDMQEEREKVTPETKVARYSIVATDTLDNAEVVHEMDPERPTKSVLDESEADHDNEAEEAASDVVEEAEFDFKSAEDKFRTLYAAKAQKTAEDMFLSYVDKFKRCMKVASVRMRLNYDVDPFKVAMADVLINEDHSVCFSDGVRYEGMEVSDAVELIECIAHEGHSKFVDHLFKKSEDLMDKSDEYLRDLESDIKSLAPVSVEAGSRTSRRKESLSDVMEDNNFDIKPSSKVASTQDSLRESVRNVIGSGFRVGGQLRGINRVLDK
jgi:hypothetical protein